MGFISLIVALLLEQVKPLQNDNAAYVAVRSIAAKLERNFNAGERQQGVLACLLLVLPLTLGSWLIYYLLVRAHPFLGLGWNILVLYLTLGFRQFSHHYTDIQLALTDNDLAEARRILVQWKSPADPQFSAADLGLADIARVAIEEALLASHRHVFGVFFWFVVLPGPSGAVLYRVAEYLARSWHARQKRILAAADMPTGPFGHFAEQLFRWIDWLPVRLTAIGFAIVGNFEDAIFFWRNHRGQWADPSRGILLAAGAGALGVRLGDPESFQNAPSPIGKFTIDGSSETAGDSFSESMPGVDANPAAMRSGVGLVWRSMLLWLILLLLLSVAGLLG